MHAAAPQPSRAHPLIPLHPLGPHTPSHRTPALHRLPKSQQCSPAYIPKGRPLGGSQPLKPPLAPPCPHPPLSAARPSLAAPHSCPSSMRRTHALAREQAASEPARPTRPSQPAQRPQAPAIPAGLQRTTKVTGLGPETKEYSKEVPRANEKATKVTWARRERATAHLARGKV